MKTKQLINQIGYYGLILSFLACLCTSCSKKSDPQPITPTTVTQINNTPDIAGTYINDSIRPGQRDTLWIINNNGNLTMTNFQAGYKNDTMDLTPDVSQWYVFDHKMVWLPIIVKGWITFYDIRPNNLVINVYERNIVSNLILVKEFKFTKIH